MTRSSVPAAQPGAVRPAPAWPRWTAWGLAGLSFALAALWLAMVIAYHRELGSASTIFDGSSAVIAVIYPAVGLLIAVRRSGNRIGWLMITIGLSFAFSCVSHAYTGRGPLTGPHAPFAGQWADWLGTWVWIPGWVFLITLLLLMFPDGHPPSRRWRPAIWAAFLSIGLMILGTWLDPNPNSEPTYHNPMATQAAKSLAGVLEVGAAVIGIGTAIACLVALVLRFRRSRGEQRQQMKWFAYAGIATLVLLPGNTVLATTPVLQVMGYVDVILLPTAIGIAILKYRLYDIDVVISKTVMYSVLAAFITAVYVLLVVGIGSLAGLGGRPNLGLSILATAVVAVAFQPVRTRAQRLANRLVYGQRATPYQADKDEAQAKALLNDVTAEIARAPAGLRELARGIYPPLLADLGVAAALDAQARKAPIAVSVEADGIGRYPQEIEAAVYFCALEALRSTAGQPGAARASVRLSARDGELRFEVAADGGGPGTGGAGPGIDVAEPGTDGTGPRAGRGSDAGGGGSAAELQAMADRIDALGGEIRIDPAPGRGTRISGSVPVAATGLRAHPGCGPATWPMASLVARPSRRIALR